MRIEKGVSMSVHIRAHSNEFGVARKVYDRGVV